MRPFQEGWEFGNFDPHIAEVMLDYDVTKIQGKRIQITIEGKTTTVDHVHLAKCDIAGIKYVEGMEAPKVHKKYNEFSNRLRGHAMGPVLREAAYTGDDTQIDEIMKKVKAMSCGLDSPCFRGHSGGTALHAAAAAG